MNNCKRVLIMKNVYILYTKFNLLVINDKRIATKGIKKTNLYVNAQQYDRFMLLLNHRI